MIVHGKVTPTQDIFAPSSNTKGPGETNTQRYVSAEQVNLLYGTFPSAALAVVVNALIISYIFRNVVAHSTIIMWLGCNAFITLLRYMLVRRFWSRPADEDDIGRWGSYYVTSVAIAGAAFGASGVFLFPSQSIAHQVFLAFILGGMVAGASGIYSIERRAFLFYSIPALTPITVRFLIEGDEIHIAMALMAILFLTVMSFTARRMFTSTLKSLELRFRNEDLVSYLSETKEKAERFNKALLEEIRVRKATEEELKESALFLAEAQEIAHIGHWKLNPETNEITGSDELFRIFGLGREEATLESFIDVVHPEDRKRDLAAITEGIEKGEDWNIEHRLVCRDGIEKNVHAVGEARTDETGKTVLLVGTVQDITERKQAVESIVHMAYHDSLTGLPNRALLTDHLRLMLAAAQRRKILAAVLFIDLDRFKLINDTMGHSKGDEVLKAVAERLQKHTRKADTLARQGGDEFILLVQDLNRVEDITKVAENIFSAFKEPFGLGVHKFFITVSMGISIYPNDGEGAETLIKNADIALYAAKDEGRNNYQLYSASMNMSIVNRLRLENKLRKALDNEQFLLHYQPQVDSTSCEVTGVEALVRWQDPQEGLISPGEFIPVAEDTRLIIPIGEWVLREACTQNKLWQDEGLKQITMAVNISTHQFKQKDFVDTVERILKETDLNPKYLELELTESIIMKDIETTIETLHALKAMGIRLSIDDFGTGYSSLEYLKRMPIDMLKVAQTFVRDITTDPNDAAIARATIQLARSLQLEVIAEGVETREHLKLLNDLQCTRIQGYLFSKPLPSHEIEKYLKKEWRFVVEQVD